MNQVCALLLALMLANSVLADQLVNIDLTTGAVRIIGGSFTWGIGLAFDSNDNLYIKESCFTNLKNPCDPNDPTFEFSRLYIVDPSTGEIQNKVELDQPLRNSLTIDAADVLYSHQVVKTRSGSSVSYIYKIDPVTGLTSRLSNMIPSRIDNRPEIIQRFGNAQAIDISALDFFDKGSNAPFYGVRGDGGEGRLADLITIDPATGELIDIIGLTGLSGVGGMAVNPIDGKIYAAGGRAGKPGLHTLNPQTGAATPIGGNVVVRDMGFDSKGNLYAVLAKKKVGLTWLPLLLE